LSGDKRTSGRMQMTSRVTFRGFRIISYCKLVTGGRLDPARIADDICKHVNRTLVTAR